VIETEEVVSTKIPPPSADVLREIVLLVIMT
jgi:hypothetical protein